MIRALGWPLVALWGTWSLVLAFAISLDWGGTLAILTSAAVTLGTGLLLLVAFHRGRISAFHEAAELAHDLRRARRGAGGNGGTR